ncbi:rab5b protein [Cystoisospora suis]|uniref:Rab5b protein n=1 Tax=Cystoisospora suis TaxID=483139 RepID=A0A2C6KK51_9APIC|nr:rab5b protein [Cystoisospora suis]
MGCSLSSAGGGGGLASGDSSSSSQLRISQAAAGGPWGLQPDGGVGRLSLEAKIVLLGDSGVGKSSLALRFCRGRFPQYHEVTIGAAFLQQTVRVDKEGSQVKLYIWDTGGQERFRAMAPLYYRDAAGAVVVYDVTAPSSMDAVKFWVRELKQRGPANCCIAVAANKSDDYQDEEGEEEEEEEGKGDTEERREGPDEEDGETSAGQREDENEEKKKKKKNDKTSLDAVAQRREEMRKYCEAEGMTFIECSAKTGYNVGLLFEQLAKEVFEHLRDNMVADL